MHNIDWSRIAKPQEDGYDVAVLSDFDAAAFGWKKVIPQTPVTLAEGTVGVCSPIRHHVHGVNVGMGADTIDVGDTVTAAWAARQTQYLSAWPAGYYALQHYLDEFWPWEFQGPYGKGCSSGHFVPTKRLPIHAVYIVMNDPEGCAQGIYHEMAHLRLRSLGIEMETHSGLLLTNEDAELYTSSVRFDKKRPMPAVLQGLYAWLMFVENDWQLFHAGLTPVGELRAYTAHNLPKIANGVQEVKMYARTTPAGEIFLASLYDWAYDLIDRISRDLGI